MNISEATIHELKKLPQTSGIGTVTENPRHALLPIDGVLITLCSDLLGLYAKAINSNGILGQDKNLHIFPIRLSEYFSGTLNFQDFTIASLKLIANEMKDSIFSSGGYALFLRYENNNEDFLLVAMLKLKPGAGIDAATLSLQSTLTIDLNLLHEAARINLTRWKNGAEPYLTFITGRAKQGDVTAYFRNSLSCLNFTSSSHHTSEVIKAAGDFIESKDLTQEEKHEERVKMRERLYECFAANAEEIAFPTLAAAVNPQDPQGFIEFVRTGPLAANYTINDNFQPDRNIYRKIKRISGKIGRSVTVAFDVADVQARKVYYDAQIDGLVLKSPPESIKQAIKANAPQ